MGFIGKILAIISLCLCFSGIAQEVAPIEWHPDRKLTWKDFQGKPFKTSWAAATTASGISYEYNGIERNGEYDLDFKVTTYFYPDKSWYHPKLCDAVVLNHEQLHFDISEIFARKFRERLHAKRFGRNVKAEVSALYRQVLRELDDFQELYDKQTDYSRDRKRQLEWNAKIHKALAQTQEGSPQ